MKVKVRIITTIIMMCLHLPLVCANTSFFRTNSYDISARAIGGYIMPLSKNLKNIATGPVLGAELSIEFPRLSQYNWYNYWGGTSIGASVAYYNLGNNKLLGNAVALYPYISVPIFDNGVLKLNYKLGAGLGFLDKTWNRADTLSGVVSSTANSAIGSVVNAYINMGFAMRFNVSRNFQIGVNLEYVHMSNGSILQPNAGLNMLTASVGATYQFQTNCATCNQAANNHVAEFPYRWSLNVTASGGVRELYYKDDKKYGIASLHVGGTYQFAPFYAFGGGVDLFYDGVYVRQGTTADMSAELKKLQQQHTHFNKYLIMEDALKNKFRAGVCLSNEFVIGRVTAILDWGVYLYDPVKKHRHDKMFYKYDADKDDGWNYFRLGIRCRVWDNMYLQTSIKTHLQKAEFIEFGIGYQIPFKKKQNSASLFSGGWGVHHHGKRYKRPIPTIQQF